MDDQDRRVYEAPYGKDHPIPSIHRYQEALQTRKARAAEQDVQESEEHAGDFTDDKQGDQDAEDTAAVDTTETPAKGKRSKALKKRDDSKYTRVVTDPVTHLPVKIQDFTSIDVPPNDPPYGTTPSTASGFANKEKSSDQLISELKDIAQGQAALQAEFPPPEYQTIHKDLVKISQQSTILSIVGTLAIGGSIFSLRSFGSYVLVGGSLLGAALIASTVYGISSWADRRIQSLWDAAVWQGKFREIEDEAKHHQTETTAWLNSLLAAVWPLINPDLFTSLSDTLEDVMQASLPSIVRMVSVDDIGQGSESLRILGIRWLPSGAAARDVSENGKLSNIKRNDTAESDASELPQGLSAEEGDFINLEVAFAYRASSSGRSFKDRMNDMHLYLAFYLPGNIKLPVWVDLRGIIGLMRIRLQLTPDPPFFGLATITLLGQPKVELSCVPVVKRGLNLMNLPVLNGFVQSSIDAAMSEYVAPRSLTLDLKDMITGDDFKKDVTAHGVLMIEIVRGYDFKTGDMGIPLIKGGSADPYITVGWAKFGKPVWSTRILESEMDPVWNETTYILVTPDELNVDERLRLQLWDSDRFTADDDLGRIEIDIKKLMQESSGKMHTRRDGFRALKAGKQMPGELEWRVGYFPKLDIQQDQLKKQTFDKEVRTYKQLEDKATAISKEKLREAQIKGQKDKAELEQQRNDELRYRESEMIIDAPPPQHYPSGVLSIQIHQITGLELQKLHKSKEDEEKRAQKKDNIDDEEEESDDLPSSYCTIILNHAKIYKTRVKPKNAGPFFNAGTERFIPDWRQAEVHVSVRNSTVHEDDYLLGIVTLPLADVFASRSQSNATYPIAGGMGYGRIRISMVWRSVKLQAPANLLGWQLGTVEVGKVEADNLPEDIKKLNLKLATSLSIAKLHAKKGWQKERNSRLAVTERYSSCFTVRFRAPTFTGRKTEAFAILWLRDLEDEDTSTHTLTVWKGDFKKAIKSSIFDCGEEIGKIRVQLTFWPGLGTAHRDWAIKQADIRDVIQVLETAHDNHEASKTEREAGAIDEDASSDDSSDEEADDGATRTNRKSIHATKTANDAQEPDEKTGAVARLVEEVKDYKNNYKSIHRQNRGIMTWKAPRTAQWAFHSAEKVEHKLAGIFKRHSRGKSIETEV